MQEGSVESSFVYFWVLGEDRREKLSGKTMANKEDTNHLLGPQYGHWVRKSR